MPPCPSIATKHSGVSLSSMHRRLAELIEYAARQRAELLAAVHAVPESGRNRKLHPAAWSVAEILEHLHRVETGIVRLLQRGVERARAAGAPLEQEDGSLLARSTRSDSPTGAMWRPHRSRSCPRGS